MSKLRTVALWMLSLFVIAAGFSGCTARSIYHGLYEGARVRHQLQSTPPEQLGKRELPSDYEGYESMRRKSGN